MRRSLIALHVVALAVWLGGLTFSFLLAATLFGSLKAVCPACVKPLEKEATASCATCGALHHAACAGPGCGLEHDGPRTVAVGTQVASVTTTGLAQWQRVKVRGEVATP